jgi:hypothetical protein
MVVTAGAMTLKGVVLDEGEGKKEKKEESPQALPRRKNDGNQNVPD